MLQERLVYMDDRFVPWEKAQVHIMSHSFARGSGIFEVLGVHESSIGTCVFRLDEYVDRFFKSAELLGMKLKISAEQLFDGVFETVRRNGLRSGMIKIMGFYPQVAFDIMPPSVPLSVAVVAVDPAADLGKPAFSFEKGVSASISSWRKIDPKTVPAEAKVAANYLNGMMARLDASRRGFEFALMLDDEGFIAEGGTESVFLVKDGRLLTPALGKILRSISRKSVQAVAASDGIETVEANLPPEVIQEADEVFFSSTLTKVMPVRSLDDRVFEPAPGPVSKRIRELMDRVVEGKIEQFSGWLFPV